MLNRTVQWAYNAENKFQTKYSFFLDERQLALCETVLQSVKFDGYSSFGGYESAQRKVLGFFAPYDDKDLQAFPIVPLTFTYRKSDRLTHRDFLGAVMSLKVSRESVGDIIVSEGKSAVFLYETVAEYVLQNLNRIGRTGVKADKGFDPDMVSIQNFEELKGTVASLRLDCIVALALHISREKAGSLISSLGADVNYAHISAPSCPLKEGDKFSVRGYGKFRLEHIGGASRKQRVHITLTKYV
ncbi:YlmH/Sll1252 family protein [Ruminococcus sp. Marseille-P6503]|uniref:YlmH family RNA-binding protein n=1 Tax=Ruminococcus sp. Marseille-P6503 TaxID=2364796 RepID=UPI000F5256BD|nr:YlmH/Sll1252 family protein [Ruminococcus sp. Marseille-P6503]